jgi:aminoglycoside phosphotransferase family enzyme
MRPDALPSGADRASTVRSVTVLGRGRRHAAELAAKVAFLSLARSYPPGTHDVARIETHMSWVFLTEEHAYKLKKPARTAYVDLRSLAARAHNCIEEVRLNRRLSSNVYLGVIPLVKDAAGSLALAASGDVVDWIVAMRRLPSDRMLDHLIRAGTVSRRDIDALAGRLCDFYRRSPSCAIAPARYRQDFADGIAACRLELCRPANNLSAELVERICARQLAFLSCTALFDARVHDGRIVEGHGDLRPEHICLEAEPQIIDCLEFSRRLRTLDAADELGFLALECERLGAPDIGRQIIAATRSENGDAAPDALVDFYQSYRACVRAMLAILHLRDAAVRDPAKWAARAVQYLELAHAHGERCA